MSKSEGFAMRRNNWGFWLTFSNGVTLSVQFGWGNYCENYDNKSIDYLNTINGNANEAISRNAEMAVFYKDDFITSEFDDILLSDGSVAGHVYIDKIADLLPELKKWKPKEAK